MEDANRLQQIFLDEFLNKCRFEYACNALQCEFKDGTKAHVVVGKWLVEDAEFALKYEKASKVVDTIRAERCKELLAEAGSGNQKTGKEAQIGDPNMKAAHMFLEYHDRPKWSSKAPVEKGKGRKLLVGKTRIAGETELNGSNGDN
jgi:hypothetical protein